jgi:dCMP deaminase
LKIYSKTRKKMTKIVKTSYQKLKESVQMITRPNWDDVWMATATLIAQRSYDPRYQVGVVIVSEDNTQVFAVGYNGNYKGGPNEVESDVPGESGMIHAEINALLKMDYNNPKRKIMYITLSPCRMCAKAIVNAGISEVVYEETYRDPGGLDILKSADVNIRQI